MSSVSRNVLEQLTRNYLWMKTLQSSSSTKSDDSSKQKSLTQSMTTAATQLQTAVNTSGGGGGDLPSSSGGGGRSGAAELMFGIRGSSGGGGGSSVTAGGGGSRGDTQMGVASTAGTARSSLPSTLAPRVSQRTRNLNAAVSKVVSMATDELYESTLTHAKKQVFP